MPSEVTLGPPKSQLARELREALLGVTLYGEPSMVEIVKRMDTIAEKYAAPPPPPIEAPRVCVKCGVNINFRWLAGGTLCEQCNALETMNSETNRLEKK